MATNFKYNYIESIIHFFHRFLNNFRPSFLVLTEVANIANCTFPIRQLGYISLENSLQSLKNARILCIIRLDVD